MEDATQRRRRILAHPRGDGEQRRGEVEGEVGLPRSSATTETSSRVSLSESIVRTKFAPYGLKSHAVRTMTLLAQRSATSLSPSSWSARRRFSALADHPRGRAIERAVEHVIGGQLQQRRADPSAASATWPAPRR